MNTDFNSAVTLGQEKYPKSTVKSFQYGTAGFRDKATELSHVMYRMGLLAVLRSKAKHGCTVGLMITASHNPEEDNGIKLCDPLGDMLNQEWENLATQLVNSENELLYKNLAYIVETNKIDYKIGASIYLAKDTRSSSTDLLNAALDGVKVLGAEAKSFDLLTTPQLHFVVCCQNNKSYGNPSPEGYYEKLSGAFEALRSYKKERDILKYDKELYVDCANGVGAFKLKELFSYVKSSLTVHIFNDGSKGVLNFKCGADFVKVEQKPPEGCEVIIKKRYASFDGDADRLIYYYKDQDFVFHLLDGDKIATLFAKYLKELVVNTKLNLEMRVIQTAYANGSSTNYIEKCLNIPVVCVPTGVKYLHHEAKQCDIGIYFEANGHGTVVFSDQAKTEIKNLSNKENGCAIQKMMAKKLLDTIDLINETVGDAMSDLLLVEAILYDYDWGIEDWISLYKDFPNKQLKVKVPDRQAITTTDAERKCVKPEGLQAAIDCTVSNYVNARAFVRPSGTEDVVRVYAEADTQDYADSLAQEISFLVKQFTNKS